MILDYMNVDMLCMDVKDRINEMNKPLNHFLELKYVPYDDHLKYLRHFIIKGHDNKILKLLAQECLPIIQAIREKNVELFKNISQFGKNHTKLKRNERSRGEERVYQYGEEIVNDPGIIINFTEDQKRVIFHNNYLLEINEWEKLFKEILSHEKNKKKERVTTLDVKAFNINDDQAHDFIYLSINECDRENEFLFKNIDASYNQLIKDLFDSEKEVGKECSNKIYFNCENCYAALIFNWFKIREHIPNILTKLENSQTFYSKKGTLLKEKNLTSALSAKMKKYSCDWKTILHSRYNKKSSVPDPDMNSDVTAVVKYLSFRLYEIFEKGKI